MPSPVAWQGFVSRPSPDGSCVGLSRPAVLTEEISHRARSRTADTRDRPPRAALNRRAAREHGRGRASANERLDRLPLPDRLPASHIGDRRCCVRWTSRGARCACVVFPVADRRTTGALSRCPANRCPSRFGRRGKTSKTDRRAHEKLYAGANRLRIRRVAATSIVASDTWVRNS